MDLCQLYQRVEQYVSQINTEAIWKGFRPLRFALYDDSICCFDGQLMEKSPAFLGNTSIEYRGEWIAVWYVQEEMDPVILASKIIHEMYHGFQQMNQESRFPNELQALCTYRYLNENLSAKLLLFTMRDTFCQHTLSCTEISRHLPSNTETSW